MYINIFLDYQDIEADWTIDGPIALVSEGGCHCLLVNSEARPTVEGVDLFVEAKAAQCLRTFDAVVELIKNEGSRATALVVHKRCIV